jgi:hypothetical protein
VILRKWNGTLVKRERDEPNNVFSHEAGYEHGCVLALGPEKQKPRKSVTCGVSTAITGGDGVRLKPFRENPTQSTNPNAGGTFVKNTHRRLPHQSARIRYNFVGQNVG